jgi:hypothetical protein
MVWVFFSIISAIIMLVVFSTAPELISTAMAVTGPEPDVGPASDRQALQAPSSTSGLKAGGKIDSLISINATNKWIATGDWNLLINAGSPSSLVAEMSWQNIKGTLSHTHGFDNFKPSVNGIVLRPDKSVALNGSMNVLTNGHTTWRNVPTSINIEKGKTITIFVDDTRINHHFGGQPIYGIVSSFEPCSNVPGHNMQVLPSCTSSVSTISNKTATAAPVTRCTIAVIVPC